MLVFAVCLLLFFSSFFIFVCFVYPYHQLANFGVITFYQKRKSTAIVRFEVLKSERRTA